MGCIYIVTNKVNGKRYIGQTVRKMHQRKREHLNDAVNGSTVALHKAIRKYGEDSFLWDVVHDNVPNHDMNELEQFLIFKLKTNKRMFGYNMTIGGQTMINPWSNDGHREHIRECQLKAWTEERKKAFSEDNHAAVKVMCLETGEVFKNERLACDRFNITPGNLSNVIGSSRTRRTAGGYHFIRYERDLTEQERTKLIIEIGTPSPLGSSNPNSRKTRCVETGIVYNTRSEAAKSVEGNPDNIKQAINKGKPYKGYHWEAV